VDPPVNCAGNSNGSTHDEANKGATLAGQIGLFSGVTGNESVAFNPDALSHVNSSAPDSARSFDDIELLSSISESTQLQLLVDITEAQPLDVSGHAVDKLGTTSLPTSPHHHDNLHV